MKVPENAFLPQQISRISPKTNALWSFPLSARQPPSSPGPSSLSLVASKKSLFFFYRICPSNNLQKQPPKSTTTSLQPLLFLSHPLLLSACKDLLECSSTCHPSIGTPKAPIWFLNNQPCMDTWLLEIVTLGKIGLHKNEPQMGVYSCPNKVLQVLNSNIHSCGITA